MVTEACTGRTLWMSQLLRARRLSLTSPLLSSMEIHTRQEPRGASAEPEPHVLLSPLAPGFPTHHLSLSLSCPDALTEGSGWSQPLDLGSATTTSKGHLPLGSAGLPKGLTEEGVNGVDRSTAVWKQFRVVWTPFRLSNLQALSGD